MGLLDTQRKVGLLSQGNTQQAPVRASTSEVRKNPSLSLSGNKTTFKDRLSSVVPDFIENPVKEFFKPAPGKVRARDIIRELPGGFKDILTPSRGFSEEELAGADPSLKQRLMSIPKLGAEIIGGGLTITSLLGDVVAKSKSVQALADTSVGKAGAFLGEKQKKVSEGLLSFAEPKTVEEAKALRVADLATLFIGEIKLSNTSARVIAKSRNVKTISKTLKKDVPGLTDEAADALSGIFVHIDNVDDVQTAINRIDFSVNKAKPKAPPVIGSAPKAGTTPQTGLLKQPTKVSNKGTDLTTEARKFKTSKPPYRLTQKEFIREVGDEEFRIERAVTKDVKFTSERFGTKEMNRAIEEKVGSADNKKIAEHFINKNPELKGLSVVSVDASGSSFNIGRDAKGNFDPTKSTIELNKNATPMTVRHEIEHALDASRGVSDADRVLGFKHFPDIPHNDFNFAHSHRQAVKKALSEGKIVPAEVLKDYPDLKQKLPAKPLKFSKEGIPLALNKRERAIAEGEGLLSTTPKSPIPASQQREVPVSLKSSIQQADSKIVQDQSLPSKVPQTLEEVYKKNREIGGGKKPIGQKVRENVESIKEGADKILGVISTRLKNLNPKLKADIRKFEFNLSRSQISDIKQAKPFLSNLKKLSKDDYNDFDLATKNRDTKKLDEIMKKNGMEKEYTQVKDLLNKMHKRANDIGLETPYQSNYYPRSIRDTKSFLKFLEERPDKVKIDEAVKLKEEELDRFLTEEEIATVSDMYIGQQEKTNVQTSFQKERKIDFIDAEMNKFYNDPIVALNSYITQINDAIESWRFFNLGTKVDKFTKIDDSIASYTLQRIADNTITPDQSRELETILKARFKEVGTRGITTLYKNLAYIDTMGSPISAITQFADLSFALYRTGPFRTTSALIKSLLRIPGLRRGDVGIDKIAHEFSGSGLTARAVNTVFKAVGLEAMDALGKEVLINSTISLYRKQAKNPTKEFMLRIEAVFGKNTVQILEDLKSGAITDNVKLLAFNELLNVQPLKLSEMPEQYLVGGNARIFYMLKTYTIKLFDVYRNEVYHTMKRDKLRGLQNLIALGASLIVMNATADEIKDLILGRETTMTDRLVDNVLKLMGVSKWTIYNARQEGLFTSIAKTILPPFKVFDSIYKDVVKQTPVRDWKTIGSIPVVGKLYYWWFGKGARADEKSFAEQARDKVKELDKLNEDEFIVEWEKLKEEDPELAKDTQDEFDERALNLSTKEKRIRILGVRNKERAKEVARQLNHLDTQEEKNALWNDYVTKKIITKEVDPQIDEFLNK